MSNNSTLNINDGSQVLIQDKYLINTATSINNNSEYIYTKTTNDQINKLTGGNYSLTAEEGNISLIAENKDIILTSLESNIILTAGTSILNVSSTGGSKIVDSEIQIGDISDTANININSSDNINLSSDAITTVTTDNTIIKSTDGEIILDTSPQTGNNALTINNDGQIIMNGEESLYGYQLEVNITSNASSEEYKNGISVNNLLNENVSPEIRTVLSDVNGGNRIINAMGIYSESDIANKYRNYIGYQYGNQIITIEGLDFNVDDIGKSIYFEDDNRETEIIDLGTIILPADNTFNNSDNTLTAGGIYTGNDNKIFIIKIDSNLAVNNTFKWSNNSGISWNEQYIPCIYATNKRYPLSDGIYISLSSSTGYNINDYWTIQAKKTAIVNSNIIINGNSTIDISDGIVVTSIIDNVVNTEISNIGSPVFSNITGDEALSRLQSFKTLSRSMVGYIGTSTNDDLILQTAGEPRLTLTGDGAFALTNEPINSRLQISSNFNKSLIVNNNVLSNNIIGDEGQNNILPSNLSQNILKYQQNPTGTELNNGSYVVIYESQNTNSDYDIYGDVFTANGDRIAGSFQINSITINNQSHPHVAKSEILNSDNYLVVWNSNVNGSYQIRGQLMNNNNEKIGSVITISESGYTPRVCGLSNGNYMVCYTVLNTITDKYDIRYVILNSLCNVFLTSETIISDLSTINYIYPYGVGLNLNDVNRPSGFVIAYLKQLFNSDNRYQIVFKLFDADGGNISNEIEITTTGIANPGEFVENTDLSLSDSLICLERIPKDINNGFLISYQVNYSASVPYTNIVSQGVRNVLSVSGNGNGNLTSANIDSETGIQTLTLTDVNGSFLAGEQIFLTSDNGFLLEKIDSLTQVGTTVTIILSRDPKSISAARYDSEGNLIWRNSNVSSTPLELDNELINLNSILPIDYLREENNKYAFRSIPVIKANNDRLLVAWNNGNIPSIYYQELNINDGSKYDVEYIINEDNIGLRQVNPWIVNLKSKQNISYGYGIIYNINSLDLSKTAIYQELIGLNSYLAKFTNNNAKFNIDNDGRMLLGIDNSNSTVHIKTSERKKGNNNIDLCKLTLENSSNGIITNNDLQLVNFQTNENYELSRISIKYSNNYQGLINENLITYFKFDEINGTSVAKDSGIHNIQSNENLQEVQNKVQNGQLINFDINNCWVKGKINNGLEFNGESSYLKIPLNSSVSSLIKSLDTITSDDFSISFWFKINGSYVPSNTEMDILTYGESDVGDISNGGGYFQLYFRDIDGNGNLKTCFRWASEDGSGNNEEITSIKVNDDNWHHLVISHVRNDNSIVEIYLDNDIIYSETLTGLIAGLDPVPIDVNVYIGAGIGGQNNFFRGILDEFRVYNKFLETKKINYLWTYGNSICGQIKLQSQGENTDFNSDRQGLILDDTNRILSAEFKNNNFNILRGYIYVNPNDTLVIGLATLFLSEVKPGDYLYIDNTDSNIETEGQYANTFNQKLYLVKSVISNNELIINRIIPDISMLRYFRGITIKPSILSFYDINNTLKGLIDYNGDLIIGEGGKSAFEYTKMEIRGSGDYAYDKNGLTLTSTSLQNLNTDNARINRIITQSLDTTGDNTVLQSMISSSHSGDENDNKSKMQFWINDGNSTTNLNSLISPLTISSDSKINIGQTEEANKLLGDIHLRAQNNNKAIIALFSEESAIGTFTESSELTFYGKDSINEIYNDSRSLAKIKVSNDNTYLTSPQLANGRIDFEINNEDGSSLKGLKSRMCLTADGSLGIHNIRPNNPLSVNPEFIDNNEQIFNSTITSYDSNTRLLTFTIDEDTIFNNSSKASLLRNGQIVINNNGILNKYAFDNGVNDDLNPTLYQIRLKEGYTISNDEIIGKEFNIYYSGLEVNKYGMVSIGDSNFNNTNDSYYLNVSGNTIIKGELMFAANISINTSETGFKVNNNGQMQIKDINSAGYVNILQGPKVNALNSVSTSTILNWNQSTILADTQDIIITLPSPESKYNGYCFTIKNIAATGVININTQNNETIDGSLTYILNNQYDTITVQTDSNNWFIISKI